MKTGLLILASALAANAGAESSAPATLAAIEMAIERACLRADADALGEAVRPLDAALAREPDNAALLYTRAFGHYAATASLRAAKEGEAIRVQLERAVALLLRVKDPRWKAEVAALHGGILGQLIDLEGGVSGMMLGPKSRRLLEQATQAAPANPRVLLFRGIAQLNTPPIWGGDPAEGAALLQQAVDRFEAGVQPAGAPRWGHAEALAWLGIARQRTGDAGRARNAWEQALLLEPDYRWVRLALLPSLGKNQGR